MVEAVDVLRRRVDYSITVFRAGFVTLVLAGIAFLYLWMVNGGINPGSIIGGVVLAVIPALCFVAGLINYATSARALRTVYGDRVSGLLRRRSTNLRAKKAQDPGDASPLSNVDEASWQDIISRLGEDEGR